MANNPEAMAPYGLALQAYFNGDAAAEVLIRRDDGIVAPVPAKYFFRAPTELSAIEKLALEQCRGRILDVGAGSGIHSLALQAKGMSVTALDVSPEAVEVMTRRGVRSVVQADIFDFKDARFDTLLLLGHGIGITGTLEGLRDFLTRARDLVGIVGQLLLDSLDVSCTRDSKNLDYQEANRRKGRYAGEIRFQLEYKGKLGPMCNWLQVDPWTLADYAAQTGWICETLLEQEGGEHLARLRRPVTSS